MSSSRRRGVPSTPFGADCSDVRVLIGRNSFRKRRIPAHFGLKRRRSKDLITFAVYEERFIVDVPVCVFKPYTMNRNACILAVLISTFLHFK